MGALIPLCFGWELAGSGMGSIGYGVKRMVMIITSDHELAVRKRCYENRPARKKNSLGHGIFMASGTHGIHHRDLEKPEAWLARVHRLLQFNDPNMSSHSYALT